VMITPTYARASAASPPQANALLRLRNAMCAGRRHRFVWVLVSSEVRSIHWFPYDRVGVVNAVS
jgi:hypothetical protein